MTRTSSDELIEPVWLPHQSVIVPSQVPSSNQGLITSSSFQEASS
jgi:hypothetical protein